VDTEFASNIACKSSFVWISGRRSLGTDDELNPTFGSESNSYMEIVLPSGKERTLLKQYEILTAV
jgi:hypothetical protein